jgi:hypothetical protein
LKDLPPKLSKFLSKLSPEENTIQQQRYDRYLNIAIDHRFQSPRFWAMRMILSGEDDRQIQRRITKKIKKTGKEGSSATGVPL